MHTRRCNACTHVVEGGCRLPPSAPTAPCALTPPLSRAVQRWRRVRVHTRLCVFYSQVDAPHPLPPATLGTSGTLRAGEYVVALGSPLFLHNSLTLGIVSAVARPGSDMGLRQKGDYIQVCTLVNTAVTFSSLRETFFTFF
jgi:hypothetical protein